MHVEEGPGVAEASFLRLYFCLEMKIKSFYFNFSKIFLTVHIDVCPYKMSVSRDVVKLRWFLVKNARLRREDDNVFKII